MSCTSNGIISHVNGMLADDDVLPAEAAAGVLHHGKRLGQNFIQPAG